MVERAKLKEVKRTCKACMALPADSLLLKFTKAQYFSGKQRTLVTAPYLERKSVEKAKNLTKPITYFENIESRVLLVTSGSTLPTQRAVRPSGLRESSLMSAEWVMVAGCMGGRRDGLCWAERCCIVGGL